MVLCIAYADTYMTTMYHGVVYDLDLGMQRGIKRMRVRATSRIILSFSLRLVIYFFFSLSLCSFQIYIIEFHFSFPFRNCSKLHSVGASLLGVLGRNEMMGHRLDRRDVCTVLCFLLPFFSFLPLRSESLCLLHVLTRSIMKHNSSFSVNLLVVGVRMCAGSLYVCRGFSNFPLPSFFFA